MKKPRTSTKLALRIARAQLRAVRQAVGHFTTASVSLSPPRDGIPQFIQGWAVNRGYSGITQALDTSGQVWERHTKGSKIDGTFVIESSWWEPISMERRALVQKETT